MDNPTLWFILSAIATYRCASIVSSEEGPGDIFQKLRDWALANATWLYKGLKCFACTSVWFGTFFSLLIAKSFSQWLILTFAISGLAILIYIVDAWITRKAYN